jgi:hypothetical protein
MNDEDLRDIIEERNQVIRDRDLRLLWMECAMREAIIELDGLHEILSNSIAAAVCLRQKRRLSQALEASKEK